MFYCHTFRTIFPKFYCTFTFLYGSNKYFTCVWYYYWPASKTHGTYWVNYKSTDCENGGTWEDNIYGGEGLGGFTDGNDIFLAGNIQHIGNVDSDGNPIEGEPGITPHYWKNGQLFDLPGGPVFDNYWVGGARDIFVKDGQIIIGGWASSKTHSQIAVVWINSQLTYLEDKNMFPSIVNSIFIE